jgi:peptide deformylase
MLVLMREAKGVGLAGPQVGLSIRLFVCNLTEEAASDMVFVNPVFAERTGSIDGEEGCLSIPGVNVMMHRSARVVIEAQDPEGKPIQQSAEQLLARVWQHESDHLDGRLIVDNMSPTDEITNRRALKQLEADYTAARKR